MSVESDCPVYVTMQTQTGVVLAKLNSESAMFDPVVVLHNAEGFSLASVAAQIVQEVLGAGMSFTDVQSMVAKHFKAKR